jgi:hypothetical protein
MLAFEVVDFSRLYDVILGQPCYVKFMVIPSYAYLKLKILGPAGVITVEAKTYRALECEHNIIELATFTVDATKLRELCLCIPLPLPPHLAWPCSPHPAPARQLRMPWPCISMPKTLPRPFKLGTT